MPQASYPYTNTAFGTQPMPVPFPQVFSDLSKVYPNLTGTNAAVSDAILSKLRGELSPQTLSALQDASARFGVESGMPGAGGVPGSLVQNRNLRDIGRATEDQIAQGVQLYNQTVPTVSQTQTLNPELQASINYQNSVSAAAPNPAMAASYAKNLFDKYMAKLSGGKKNSWGAKPDGIYVSTAAGGWRPISSMAELDPFRKAG